MVCRVSRKRLHTAYRLAKVQLSASRALVRALKYVVDKDSDQVIARLEEDLQSPGR